MYRRKIEEELKAWKNSAKRKPLVIKGVRQCGKTSSVKQFAYANYEHVVYRNLVRQGAELVESLEFSDESSSKVEGGKSLPEDKYAYERVPQKVWHVGNVMIDTLLANRARFRKPEVWDELGLKEKEFVVMTMHRPANVDEENHLRAMMEQIIDNVHGLPVIFPIHPRTAKLF